MFSGATAVIPLCAVRYTGSSAEPTPFSLSVPAELFQEHLDVVGFHICDAPAGKALVQNAEGVAVVLLRGGSYNFAKVIKICFIV